jgi:hypothetical protein
MKSAGAEVPDTICTLDILSGAAPMLVRITGMLALVAPTSVFGKAALAGLRYATGTATTVCVMVAELDPKFTSGTMLGSALLELKVAVIVLLPGGNRNVLYPPALSCMLPRNTDAPLLMELFVYE